MANSLMRAETKAKRRVTLSICSLGFADESEVETIPGAERPVPSVVEPKKPVAVLPAPSGAGATEDQLRLLTEFAEHFDWAESMIAARLQKSFGVQEFSALSDEQARRLLNSLITKYGSPETWDLDAEQDEERAAIQQEGTRS